MAQGGVRFGKIQRVPAPERDPVKRAYSTGTVEESKAALQRISQAGSRMHQSMVALAKMATPEQLANINTLRNRENISHGLRAEELLQGISVIDRQDAEAEKQRQEREYRRRSKVAV